MRSNNITLVIIIGSLYRSSPVNYEEETRKSGFRRGILVTRLIFILFRLINYMKNKLSSIDTWLYSNYIGFTLLVILYSRCADKIGIHDDQESSLKI